MNLLRKGQEWLASTRHTYATESVYYWPRGSSIKTALAGTMAQSEFTSEDEDGQVAEMNTVDWLIRAADVPGGAEPRPGDRIIFGSLAAGEVYEVTRTPGGTAWRWSDPPVNAVYRVHTLRVGTMATV